jgi:plasmid maintenance system antidote protein VapI
MEQFTTPEQLVREMRKTMSQRKVAKALGISSTSVFRISHGKSMSNKLTAQMLVHISDSYESKFYSWTQIVAGVAVCALTIYAIWLIISLYVE